MGSDHMNVMALLLVICCCILSWSSTTAENVLAIRHDAVLLECQPGVQRADVRWADRIYNSDEDDMLIFDSRNNPDLAMSADHPHSSNYEVSPQTLSLTIRNTSQADAGTYICYIITNDGEEIMAEYSVAVIGRPQCSGEAQLHENDISPYLCRVSFAGSQFPQVDWYNSSNVKLESTEQTDPTDLLSISKNLELTGLPKYDGETFTCKMAIGDLRAECSVSVEVLYHTTSLKILPQKSVYKINEELECSADGNPAPTLTWSVSEQEATIRHGQGWKIVTIPKSWSDSEQTLTCSGYNTVDGVQSEDFSKDITIQVSTESVNLDENTGSDKAPASASSAGVIGGVIAAVIVIIVIIAIVLVVKRRNKKPQGATTIPTEDDDEKKKMTQERNGPQKGGRGNDNNNTGIPDYSSPASLEYVELDFPPQHKKSTLNKNNKMAANSDDHVVYADIRHS